MNGLADCSVQDTHGFASQASQGTGMFNGTYGAMAQLVFAPTDNLAFSLDYNHRYFSNDNVYVSGGTGSWGANRPFGNNATTTDNLGVQMNWRVASHFSIGGWFGSTWADQKNGGNSNATIINWAAVLGFPDILREGDAGGLIVGKEITTKSLQAVTGGTTVPQVFIDGKLIGGSEDLAKHFGV